LLNPNSDHESSIDKNASLRALKTINPLKPYLPLSKADAGKPELAHVVYDTPKNSAPWGWKVSTYLGTKSIGAGAMVVAALLLALNGWGSALSSSSNALLGVGAPLIGGLFVAITLVLLIADLKRPDRALYLVLKSNP